MGRQLAGKYLQWPKTSEVGAEIRQHAIDQVLRIYKEGALRKDDPPFWGDEIEYAFVIIDEEKQEAKLCIDQQKIFERMEKDQSSNGADNEKNNEKKVRGDLAEYELEFSSYMIESNPGYPFGDSAQDLLRVESSMEQRRKFIDSHSPESTHPFTVSFFPALGLPDSVDSDTPDHDTSNHDNLNNVVSHHARHQAVRNNIGSRRERPYEFTAPYFMDKNTNPPGTAKTNDNSARPAMPLENPIFGAGHCGLQATFQGANEAELLMIHDQLIPLGPILLALTASTPICNGYLKDIDVRWNQLTDSVDDRQKSECKEILPRCFANNVYLANDSRLPAKYQRDLRVDQDLRKRLQDGGLTPQLATYFALSFSRDALAISEADLEDLKAADSTLAFDILDGCDWPHVNLKLPSLTNKKLGWRIEFRTMETQFTDFENAAFCIFISLIKSVIIKYKLNMYMPILAMQENMQTAHAMDAVTAEKLVFRKDPFSSGDSESDMTELLVNDIVNGSDKYIGMMPLIERYMKDVEWTEDEKKKINVYLDLVRRRASGEFWTTAKWMRQFVLRHEDYKQDSKVSGKMCFEMMREVKKMMMGERKGRMFEKA